jgi:CBS domain-containing protein
MKVKDVMTTSPLWVEEDFSIKKLTRLIFTTNRPGFPVVKNGKVIGFIAEEDIFYKIYNIHSKKLNGKNMLNDILDKKVKDYMVKDAVTIRPDDSIVDAQTLLYKHNFFQLPVVDERGMLVGILGRGDVFRYVIEKEMPSLEESEFKSFIATNYDHMIDWEKRFDFEFPTLFRIFKRHDVNHVLDVGSWTGQYSIGLAKEGMMVTGIDDTPQLINFSKSKASKLPDNIKKKVNFELCDKEFKNLDKKFTKGSFDGAICIGGVLPYLSKNSVDVLKQVRSVIKKDGVLVLQLLNLERVIEQKHRFLYSKIKKAKSPKEKEELYVEFFDKKNEKTLTQHIVSLTSDGKIWAYKGINSIDINYIKNKEVLPILKTAGFTDISISGNKGEEDGQYGQMSLVKPFDSVSSEWMTIVARA